MKEENRYHKWLLPASWLYGIVILIRNLFYQTGIFCSKKFNIPVISIGNLTAGGTGKTPHTEYLVKLLNNNHKIAVLSRGYGRKTHGFILSDTHSRQTEIGDEPYQIRQKFQNIIVAVDEDRVDGISKLQELIKPEIVILDDAFQHRAVTPSLNILIVNYRRNIIEDYLLPAGLLREPAKERDRADIIIVSKCPKDITLEKMSNIESLLTLTKRQSIFFTGIQYGDLISIDGSSSSIKMKSLNNTSVLIVSGIASPMLIEQEIHQYAHSTTVISFPDHHQFSERDVTHIKTSFLQLRDNSKIIVTTEKDATRLNSLLSDSELQSKIFVLPIEIFFFKDKEKFDNMVINHLLSFKN